MEVLKILAKYMNVKALVLEYLYDNLLCGAVDRLVAKSSNTLDNGAAEYLKPLLRTELEELLDENLAKLTASEPELAV